MPLQPAAHTAKGIEYDASDTAARVEQPARWRTASLLAPRAIRLTGERRASLEGKCLRAAVIEELDEVRSEPFLLSCLVEEHRKREVVAAIANDRTDARGRRHRFAEDVAHPAREAAGTGFLRIADSHAITEARSCHGSDDRKAAR